MRMVFPSMKIHESGREGGQKRVCTLKFFDHLILLNDHDEFERSL